MTFGEALRTETDLEKQNRLQTWPTSCEVRPIIDEAAGNEKILPRRPEVVDLSSAGDAKRALCLQRIRRSMN